MKNLKVKTLMNEVAEKINSNQMNSLRGGSKRTPIDHIGPINKNIDSKRDYSESKSFLIRSDAMKAAEEAAAKAAAEEAAKKVSRY